MSLVRPRLTDYYGALVSQAGVDFAIPFLDEDLPLTVDPFLLWKSPSQQDNALHLTVINALNGLGAMANRGDDESAARILIAANECEEVGLGLSHQRKGRRIGPRTAHDVLALFRDIPQYRNSGFMHTEEIQLFVVECPAFFVPVKMRQTGSDPVAKGIGLAVADGCRELVTVGHGHARPPIRIGWPSFLVDHAETGSSLVLLSARHSIGASESSTGREHKNFSAVEWW